MSKPLKYCLVEIDGLTGQSRKQRKRSVTKKYRKAKPFRRKYVSGGIQSVRQEDKIIWKRAEKRKHVLRVRKCAKNYEIKIPTNSEIVAKSSNFIEKKNAPVIECKCLCEICYEEFDTKDISFIDCKVKGTREKSRKEIVRPRYKAICQKCRERCVNSCPFCRSHKLNPVKVRFRKKKLPYAERMKIKKIRYISRTMNVSITEATQIYDSIQQNSHSNIQTQISRLNNSRRQDVPRQDNSTRQDVPRQDNSTIQYAPRLYNSVLYNSLSATSQETIRNSLNGLSTAHQTRLIDEWELSVAENVTATIMAPDEFYPTSEGSMTATVQFQIPNDNFRQVLESIGNAISQYGYPIGNMNNISSNEGRTLYRYQPTMDLFTFGD